MRIVADENIPLVQEFFAELGEIVTLPGRAMTRSQVKDADLLLVRSVTEVNASLLEHSRVKFVGTATIGYDHVDRDYLQQQRIGFASAPGCNADAVVEYVLSVLSVLEEQEGFAVQDKTVGIIGCGNVGGRLQQRLEKIGVRCLVNDPPLAEQGVEGLVELDELLAEADILSLHTPLETAGPYPTYHLFDAVRIDTLRPGTILINSGRGAVVDNQALRARLAARDDLVAILDVWENEPAIDRELLPWVRIATPHIAGYSLDGKVRGTEMIYHAVCQYFGLPARKKSGQMLPDPPLRKLSFSASAEPKEAVRVAVHACYDVRRDDSTLRLALRRSEDPAQAFDELRKHYPVRREFRTVKIELKSNQKKMVNHFTNLGFKVKT